MLVSCWSAKGGSGVTVVASALALLLARSSDDGSLLVDLTGDVPATLGLDGGGGPGVRAWLGAAAPPPDALARLEVDAAAGVRLLGWGEGTPSPERPERVPLLAALLAADRRPVVVDCGRPSDGDLSFALASAAEVSLLVLRPCYVALRRALAAPLRPSAVVLVSEPGRALGRAEVEDVLGVPVRAVIPWDPSVARSVDAGVLASRLPRRLERPLRHVA